MDLAVGRGLVRRWRTDGGESSRTAPGPAPVSSNQRGILIFERLRPGTPVFNLCHAVRHTGRLAEDRLDAALSTLVSRHPALRSTFDDGDGEPVRAIQDTVTVAAQWTDLRHLPEARRQLAAREHAERVAAEPFDLARGPLVRIHGCRLSDDERLLIFVAHHLVCDGVSLQVLLTELDAAYRGELTGKLPDATPPPVDDAALPFWQVQLADLPDLDLPADRGRPGQPTFRAGSVPLTVPEEVAAAAERLGRAENATLFMVLLAAFQLLLGEHSGQSDFAVGSMAAGRARPGQHGVVGLLADMLVLRADLSGRPSFRELVRRTRATFLATFTHRDVPFEKLVALLAPGRHLDGALVQASLIYHGERGEQTLAGAALEPVAVTRSALRYGVELHLWRERNGLRGSWDYGAELFEPTTATRMAQRLPVLLASALADPDRPVDQLDLLTDEERTLLQRWGTGPVPADPDITLTELFVAQVARTPNATAITDSRRDLTYRQLDELSNQLANCLRGRGVGAGDIVGIRLPRSVDLAVAMLGILKAGAAYLPLDPRYPADRTEYMRRDGSARMVVTDAELGTLAEHSVSAVDGDLVSPDSLAYVLYTSGSTGRPKGVLLTHSNVVPMVLWAQRAFSPTQLSRVLAATSISFDVSVFEFYAPLCAGGTVVVVENALALLADPPDVTMVCAVPSAARALVAQGAIPPSVRVVGLGGEAVTGTLADDLYAPGHLDAVINFYGPTEDTTYSTGGWLRSGEQPPPIGGLLPHERGYVLDGALRRAPIGAVGELYLAGRGLSRGYHGQPGLTAARYVADPFSPVPGERMYRTGDLVRYRSDGALIIVGRRDFQVQVRGQRVELGEIENTLLRHPEVRDAAVDLREGRLVGYVAAREPAGLDLDDVRAHLRRTLPVALIPSSLVVLDTLPKTPSGKVDRKALPTPDAPAGTGGKPPQGPAEELIADVWRKILELESVGREDDFFDLGGDSLLAGEVLNRLRERAGVGIPLRLVFEHSRLADLAAALPALPAARPSVAPRPPNAEPVLSFDQQRLWLECQLTATVAYNEHGRYRLRGALDVAALERSIRAIIHRHETLRTTFALADGTPVQRVAEPDPDWRITVEDLSTSDSEPAGAGRLADEQAATPFDLAEGPLFRCLLVRLSDTDHLLSITIHHIIADAWSIGLLLRELSALYQAGGDPDRAGLPALPVQYLDYAVWQRNWLTGDRLAAQVGYWRDRLAGAPAALTLPTARRRTPAQGAVGGRARATLSGDDVAALHRLCREHEVTPFMAMLAVFATVLRRWSGQDDLVVGVAVNTRGDAGVGALIGLFVNTVSLRLDLAGNPAFSDLLGRVRRAALDGYVHHGETPLDLVTRELGVVRDPARTPLFQVLLSMIDSAGEEWQLPGIEVTRAETPTQPSKFDLNLNVHHSSAAVELELRYHGDRYAPAAMQALLDQLVATLAAVAADAARGILEYEPRRRASTGIADPVAPPAPHRALRHQAVRQPDRIAVVDGARAWTYGQLAAGDRPRQLSTVLDPDEDGCDPAGQPADWAVARFGLTGDDRLTVLSGDSTLLMSALSTAMAAGATLVLADDADPDTLLTWLRRNSVTAIYLAPPLLRALPAPETSAALPLLRHVFLDNRGDLTAQDVERVRQLAPGCRVVGVYRVTRMGQPLAVYPVPKTWSVTTAPLRVPIGTELACPAVVRNPAGRPADVGEVGELCFGAVHTGDLARRRPDHVLEFAGAPADPLETVATLRDLPDVRDAVVTEYVGSDGQARLAAVVANPDRTVDIGRLRQHLVTRLPAYLIPHPVVVLDRLPLTAGGDYDLAALPDPTARGRDQRREETV